MQVEQLPAIAVRGAGAFRTPYNHYSFGRSTNSNARSSFSRSSPALSRPQRANQKRFSSKTSYEGDENTRGGVAAGAAATDHPAQTRGHYHRSRYGSSGGQSHSSSDTSGAQSKSHHHQQNHKKSQESLPPRFRTDHGNKRSSHHGHTNKKTSSSSSQAKGSSGKASSLQKSTECQSSTPPAPPTTSTAQKEQSEAVSAPATLSPEHPVSTGHKESITTSTSSSPSSLKPTIHKKMSSSADSGHCDEFVSSCESSGGVFDSLLVPPPAHHQHQEVEFVSMVTSSGAQPSLSPDTSVGDDEDDVFLDALSNIPSESSSAYMTPCSTRSRSPEPELSDKCLSSPTAQDPAPCPIDPLILEKLLILSHHDSSSSSSTVEDVTSPPPLESCDSQVTILADSGSRRKSLTCSVSFTHASSVFDISEEDRSSGSSEGTLLSVTTDFKTRRKTLSTDLTNIFIGEVPLEVMSDGEDSAIDFEVKSSSPSLHEEEDGDSGCATSIGSPDKTAPHSLDFTRPGVFVLPRQFPLEAGEESEKRKKGNPTLDCNVTELLTSELLSSPTTGGQSPREEEEKEEDEWPDLFAEENTRQAVDEKREKSHHMNGMMYSTPPPPLPPLMSVNGYVHPAPSPPISSSSSGTKAASDPSLWINTLNSHIRQQQRAVYQHHAMLFNNAYPIGPPPHQPPPHPSMFGGPPTGFPGFYPPHPPYPPPPPSSFPMGPGFAPPPHPSLPLGTTPMFPHFPPPIHHTLPLSQTPPASPSEETPPTSPSEETPPTSPSEETTASSISQSTPPRSPSPSPIICQKHKLCSTWVIWYDKITGSTRGQMTDYKDTLKNVSTIDSIEDFWNTYNNIHPPSGLANCANYHFFKKGIFPLWEDEANRQGGKWVLTIRDDQRSLDQAWLEVLLMLIGGGMEQFDEVNGVVVSRRKKGDRIALWTKKRTKKCSQKVCVELVRALCLAFQVEGGEAKKFVQNLADNQQGISLSYLYHSDSLKSGNSYSNEQHIRLKDLLDSILDVL